MIAPFSIQALGPEEKSLMSVASRCGHKIPEPIQKQRGCIDRTDVREENFFQFPFERKSGGPVQLDGIVGGSFRKHEELASVAKNKRIGHMIGLFEDRNRL